MANPAVQRSGEGEGDPGDERKQDEFGSASAFAAHTTADLIALRDQLLEECLDLENHAAAEGGSTPTADPGTIRTRIDEIHQELAFRDLTERTAAERGRRGRAAGPARDSGARQEEVAGGLSQKSTQILEAIEMRSRFLDELAQAAREQGDLDQAAAFTLNAQKLDLERVEVLRKLSRLSGESGDTDD